MLTAFALKDILVKASYQSDILRMNRENDS